ncbi:hypothetical protein [Roseibium album]|nr:hypothetical protein [Roseibium album]
MSNDDGWSNIHVSVFEIDGMDNIVVGGEIEASNPLSLSPAITTGQINTLVFYAANRYDGTEDPLSWEGGTALLSEPTGAGGASTSLWAAMAFEQAASTGNYSRTVSWLSQHGAATSCAVEIRAA